jgi:hypothetical protein
MRHYQWHYCQFSPHNEHDICVRQKYILTIVTLQQKSTMSPFNNVQASSVSINKSKMSLILSRIIEDAPS